MVIRSNGDMSITTSRDLYIGVNDKTSKNAGDKATRGTGSVCIDGSVLLLNSDNYIKATSGSIGLYGYSGTTGAGMLITPNTTSISSQELYLNTGSVFVGALRGSGKVTIGNTDKQFTVSVGTGAGVLHVRGQLQCRDITAAGTLMVSGALGANSYMELG